MTALSPGRFGPLPDDALLTRGLWQYAHYYGPVTSAPKATTPAGVPSQDQTSQPRAHRCSGLVTSGNQNSLRLAKNRRCAWPVGSRPIMRQTVQIWALCASASRAGGDRW